MLNLKNDISSKRYVEKQIFEFVHIVFKETVSVPCATVVLDLSL